MSAQAWKELRYVLWTVIYVTRVSVTKFCRYVPVYKTLSIKLISVLGKVKFALEQDMKAQK